MITDANPFMAAGSAFHPDAVYRINVDNNADIRPDAAFSFVFPPLANGEQTATGGAELHARRRPGDRSMGYDQSSPRR